MSQYKKKRIFINIKNGTPKLKTERAAKVLGGINGKRNESNNKIDATELSRKIILFIIPNFFIFLFTSFK